MLVIDASVAIKWVLPEEGSDDATRLIGSQALVAPDLLLVECANVLWTKARRRQIRPHDAEAALAAILSVPITLLPSASLVSDALRLSNALEHPAYDCLYLAAAIAERSCLVTADDSFVAAIEKHGGFPAHARRLTASQTPP